jgi:hypothetical protein
MPRPSLGAGLSISALENILRDRKFKLTRLMKQRRKAQRELDLIDRQIARIGGAGGLRGGGRAHNELSLPDAIEEVLRKSGKPTGVGDITEGVQSLGYRSNSDNFRAIVNQTLIKERRRFSPSGERGVYQLKKT